jgi:hypothetical protein
MVVDMIVLIILFIIALLPILSYLIVRWGFEEADHHSARFRV